MIINALNSEAKVFMADFEDANSPTWDNCVQGPYFYLPKLESHLEARLWNDVFVYAQEQLDIPRGAIRTTVLIENILAVFVCEVGTPHLAILFHQVSCPLIVQRLVAFIRRPPLTRHTGRPHLQPFCGPIAEHPVHHALMALEQSLP